MTPRPRLIRPLSHVARTTTGQELILAAYPHAAGDPPPLVVQCGVLRVEVEHGEAVSVARFLGWWWPPED